MGVCTDGIHSHGPAQCSIRGKGGHPLSGAVPCMQHVPRYLMSSLLDETIEAVATGLSTAVYQRPLTPRVPAKRKRKAGKLT
jgi:hypothetical protein